MPAAVLRLSERSLRDSHAVDRDYALLLADGRMEPASGAPSPSLPKTEAILAGVPRVPKTPARLRREQPQSPRRMRSAREKGRPIGVLVHVERAPGSPSRRGGGSGR